MAKDDISVSIGVQGESKFKKALIECQNTVKQLDSALKANAAEYEANADALGENVEKTRLLKESVELQKKMVDGLGDAIEYASKEYGEASAQTTKYILAQNKAREAVAKLEKELQDGDREMEELGRDSVRVGRQLEQGIGDGAEEAAKSLDDMYREMQDGIDDIRGLMGADLFGDLASGSIEIAQGVAEFVEGTRETRRQLSFIEQNAKSMGLPFEDVEDTLYHVAAITGDIEGTYEGINNLMNTGFNMQEIADAADLLVSAAIKWPETMKFEGLAESLQETVATKSAVGQYAELLERMGVDLEVVNKALEKTATDEAAQDVVLSFLANKGLEQHLAEYQVLNETMIASQEATYQLEAAWARLGGTVEKWVTPIVNAVAATVTAIDSVLSGAAFQKEREEQAEIAEEIEEKTNLYSELAEINQKIAEADIAGDYMKAAEYERERQELISEIAEAAKNLGLEDRKIGEEAEATGKDAIDSMTTAIEDETPDLINAAAAAADGVNAELARMTVPDIAGALEDQAYRINQLPTGWNLGSGGSGLQESGNPALQVALNIDGRKFASATVDYYNEAQGRQINMNV